MVLPRPTSSLRTLLRARPATAGVPTQRALLSTKQLLFPLRSSAASSNHTHHDRGDAQTHQQHHQSASDLARALSTATAEGGSGGAPPPLPPPPQTRRPTLWERSSLLRITTRLCFSTVLGIVVVTAVILIHDSTTYGTQHAERVPVHPLALKPGRGGPKNLPIIARAIEEDQDADVPLETEEELWSKKPTKPRLVIVGGGWGVSVERSSSLGSQALTRPHLIILPLSRVFRALSHLVHWSSQNT